MQAKFKCMCSSQIGPSAAPCGNLSREKDEDTQFTSSTWWTSEATIYIAWGGGSPSLVNPPTPSISIIPSPRRETGWKYHCCNAGGHVHNNSGKNRYFLKSRVRAGLCGFLRRDNSTSCFQAKGGRREGWLFGCPLFLRKKNGEMKGCRLFVRSAKREKDATRQDKKDPTRHRKKEFFNIYSSFFQHHTAYIPTSIGQRKKAQDISIAQ